MNSRFVISFPEASGVLSHLAKYLLSCYSAIPSASDVRYSMHLYRPMPIWREEKSNASSFDLYKHMMSVGSPEGNYRIVFLHHKRLPNSYLYVVVNRFVLASQGLTTKSALSTNMRLKLPRYGVKNTHRVHNRFNIPTRIDLIDQIFQDGLLTQSQINDWNM